MTVPADSEGWGVGACADYTGARRGCGLVGYISIWRIWDSCMLVCQTSSKKLR